MTDDKKPVLQARIGSVEYVQVTRAMFPDGRWSFLYVVCPHHPQEPALLTVYTGDGRHWFQSLGPESASEYVTVSPPDLGPSESWSPFLRAVNNVPAVLAADPDIEGHVRWILRCPRPSCGVNIKVGRSVANQLESFVQKMWHARIDELAITDPARPASSMVPLISS